MPRSPAPHSRPCSARAFPLALAAALPLLAAASPARAQSVLLHPAARPLADHPGAALPALSALAEPPSPELELPSERWLAPQLQRSEVRFETPGGPITLRNSRDDLVCTTPCTLYMPPRQVNLQLTRGSAPPERYQLTFPAPRGDQRVVVAMPDSLRDVRAVLGYFFGVTLSVGGAVLLGLTAACHDGCQTWIPLTSGLGALAASVPLMYIAVVNSTRERVGVVRTTPLAARWIGASIAPTPNGGAFAATGVAF